MESATKEEAVAFLSGALTVWASQIADNTNLTDEEVINTLPSWKELPVEVWNEMMEGLLNKDSSAYTITFDDETETITAKPNPEYFFGGTDE
jgi:hypothetical protein